VEGHLDFSDIEVRKKYIADRLPTLPEELRIDVQIMMIEVFGAGMNEGSKIVFRELEKRL
jgi:hypothetical protein